MINFLTSLSVCHTVVCDNDSGDVTYQSSSPDELALVQAAKDLGFELLGRSTDTVRVRNNIDDEVLEF